MRRFDSDTLTLWIVRLVWATLPLSAGPAAASALDGWSRAPQSVAAVLLWVAWAIGLLALLAPRPEGLTALRVIAPSYVVLAVIALASGAAPAGSVGGALAAVLVTGALVIGLPVVPMAAANGVAYGDERRFPLKTPPVLLAGPLPIAVLLVAAGGVVGPLLIAADEPVLGAVAVVVGFPLAAFLGRALHGLARRWVVLVPAGLVVADPLTLPDPVLFLRERIASLQAVAGDGSAPAGDGDDVVDLRLGALADSIELTLDREVEFLYIRRGRRGAVPAHGTRIRVAALRRTELLGTAAARRIRVPSGR